MVSREGKRKHRMSDFHYTSLLKGLETEINFAGLDFQSNAVSFHCFFFFFFFFFLQFSFGLSFTEQTNFCLYIRKQTKNCS